MNTYSFNTIYKISIYILIPLAFYWVILSFNNKPQLAIQDEEIFNISFDNKIINHDFKALFEDSAFENLPEKEISFKDLGVELSGIVAVSNDPERGYILLNFINKEVNKNIYRPGDKIDKNVFLESIHPKFIRVSINNKIFQIYLSDKRRTSTVDGIINLDVSLLEILPYLKIKKGTVNGTLGIYISDRVNGAIIKKLHLKETDLLFNLNGYNVFNLATLSDAYRKLENKKEITASIYRKGKITKLVARRIDV